MKNISWRIFLYLILVLEIAAIWWAIISLVRTYEKTLTSLLTSQPRYNNFEKSKAENKTRKPTPKATVMPKPTKTLKPKSAPAPYVAPKLVPPSNPGPLPSNGPPPPTPTHNQPPPPTPQVFQPIGPLPPN